MNRRSFFGALVGAVVAVKAAVSTAPSFELGKVIREANSILMYVKFPVGARKGDLLCWNGENEVIPFSRIVPSYSGYPPLAGVAMSQVANGHYWWIMTQGRVRIPFRA